MRRLLPLLVLLTACPTGSEPEAPPLPEGDFAVVITSDYVDTILGVIELETGEVTDQVAAFASGDVAGDAHDGDLFLIFRAEGQLQRYPGADLTTAPDLEVGTGDGTNPHRTAMCGGDLFVSAYDTSEVLAFDPASGELLASIDVSGYAEPYGDQRSEPATLLVDGDLLHVVLERYDFSASESSDVAVLLSIDCLTLETLAARELPRNSEAFFDPTAPGDLLVLYGGWFETDGGIARYDLDAEVAAAPLVDEADLNADVTAMAVVGQEVVYATWTWTEQTFGVHCLDLVTGDVRDAAVGLEQNIWNVQATPLGTAWVFLTLTTGAEGLAHGIASLDPTTCTLAPETDWWSFGLQPIEVVFP
jgi:hypothetical protein